MLVLVGASLAALGGCRSTPPRSRPAIVQPGLPGQPPRIIDVDAATTLSGVAFSADDVLFMQRMIGHHRQAMEMTALVPTRTSRDAIRQLAHRIALSQADEVTMMERWLEVRRQPRLHPHDLHRPGQAPMPGMLTIEEMTRLSAAMGPEFDRLFLEGMIRHHGGALRMVEDLLERDGAGQDPEIFTFASDVDADQRMEISRMSAMLEEYGR